MTGRPLRIYHLARVRGPKGFALIVTLSQNDPAHRHRDRRAAEIRRSRSTDHGRGGYPARSHAGHPGSRPLDRRVGYQRVQSRSACHHGIWVEDEGLKADLGWSEGKFTDNQRQQAARLTAAPDPDHGCFDRPLSGKTTSPVTKSAANASLDNLDKALSVADMPLVMTDASVQNIWLRMAAATQCNQQAGEFAGNGDSLSAPQKPAGLPVNERFLWRDHAGRPSGSGTPFAGSIPGGAISWGRSRYLRSPNWWAPRDYANLYKRLSGSGGDYTMQARACFPNRSTERLASSDYHSRQSFDPGHRSISSGGQPVVEPLDPATLRANRNLAVEHAQSGGSDGASGSPFPSSNSPRQTHRSQTAMVRLPPPERRASQRPRSGSRGRQRDQCRTVRHLPHPRPG